MDRDRNDYTGFPCFGDSGGPAGKSNVMYGNPSLGMNPFQNGINSYWIGMNPFRIVVDQLHYSLLYV